MANKVTVDLANKRIIANSGITSIDAETDLYSDLKEDWITNTNGELAFEFPIRTIGGDNIGAGVEVGAYFFLRNDLGWRLRPYEADHTLSVAGNLYGEDIDLPLFVPTIGGHTVAIQLERSSLTQEKNIGGGEWTTSEKDQIRHRLGVDGSVSAPSASPSLASAVVDNLKTTEFDGRTLDQILPDLLAMAAGKIVQTSSGTFQFYGTDNTTVRYTLQKTGNTRLRS